MKRNSDGKCKESADFEADFDILGPYTKVVRTYATSDCNTMQNIMPALAKKGFKVMLGVWYVSLVNIALIYSYLDELRTLGDKWFTLGQMVNNESRPNDDAHFELEKKALETYIPKYGTDNIIAITVGSEALYRKDMTGKDLASRVQEVRTLCKSLGADSIPIGFADSWNMMIEGEAVPVIQASDIVYVLGHGRKRELLVK